MPGDRLRPVSPGRQPGLRQLVQAHWQDARRGRVLVGLGTSSWLVSWTWPQWCFRHPLDVPWASSVRDMEWLVGTERRGAHKPIDSEISLEVTETFGARARWTGVRIGVSRHRWVDMDETDR